MKAKAVTLTPALMEIDKLKFWVRPETSDLKAIQEVIGSKNYERQGIKIENGEHWLDMGGYNGAFTVLALSKGAHVTTFEPDPDSYAYLLQNIGENSCNEFAYDIYNHALVANEDTEREFYINGKNGNLWRNSLVKQWKGESKKVACVNYRHFIKDDICIKMDIEGSEYEILNDLSEDTKIKKLVAEWSFDIHPEMDKYWKIIEKLQRMFKTVHYGKFDKSVETWPASWFPPRTMIYCHNS